ncbi:MAG: nodulation protein NfeD [Thermoprotei archaeon]
MVKHGYIYILLFFILILLFNPSIPVYSQSSNYVVVIRINGGIYYGVEHLVSEAIEEAERLDAPLLMIFDTPGGLLDVTDEIIKEIRNSNVPVIGYVYPTGAQAWSAGTLLLMATHIAAMAPGTLIGAAQPVIYDPTSGTYKPINESKIINPIVGIITGLAKDRGRNITAAKLFVLENLYLDEEQALKYHVIEVIAKNIDELLEKINGWTVVLDTGRNYTLHTLNARIIEYSGSLRVHVIRALSDPIVNSLIATIGVLLLIFGVLSGHYPVIPLGAGLIILSLLGTGFSANTVSILLILIGATALGIELVTPGFGILGFTGVLLIAISIALLPILNPSYLVAPSYQAMLFWIGVSIGLGLGGFTGFALYKVIKAKKQPVKIKTIPIGLTGKAIEDIPKDSTGFILVEGEYWRARAVEDVSRDDKVVVIGKEGSLLIIRKAREDTSTT